MPLAWTQLQGWKERQRDTFSVSMESPDGRDPVYAMTHDASAPGVRPKRWYTMPRLLEFMLSVASCVPSLFEAFQKLVRKKELILFFRVNNWLFIPESSWLFLFIFQCKESWQLKFWIHRIGLWTQLGLKFAAEESTGRTQFHPICSLISSSKTYLSMKT